jgi:hypothetical protein
MKRLTLAAFAILLSAALCAQGTFTIRRPLEGSSVRETVKVRIPKGSIPEGGYIGVYVNDRFLEAVMPDIEGADYVYNLDTQARGIADGPAKIEARLYNESGGKVYELGRSSVNVVVDNQTTIKIPANGFRLRYNFVPGVERVYRLDIEQETSMISQAQARLGGRAPSLSLTSRSNRLLYAVDSVGTFEGQRTGLMRIQILPDKGKATATVVVEGSNQPIVASEHDLMPLYLKITDVGREVFGSMPVYFGLDLQNGQEPSTNYYALLPWPLLPSKQVKPGDSWSGGQPFGNVQFSEMRRVEKFTQVLPSRGEFLGVRWYKGLPCALIKQTISLGAEDLKNVRNLNSLAGEAAKIDFTSTMYFALDRGLMVRNEVNLTQESLVDVGATGGGAGGGGGRAGGPGGGRGLAGAGDDGGAEGGGGRGRTQDDGHRMWPSDWFVNPDGSFQIRQNRGGRGGGRQGGPGGGPAMQGSGPGGGGTFGQRTGGGSANQKMINRSRITFTLELER